MAHVFWEKKEIAIPDFAHINNNGKRVYVYLVEKGKPVRNSRKIIIGYCVDNHKMIPNKNFLLYYPELWNQDYPDDGQQDAFYVHTGLYALTLAIGYKTNLYPLLISQYGAVSANLLMDYAMYSILNNSNVTACYSKAMKDKALFSSKVYKDLFWSDFFNNRLNTKDSKCFKEAWINECLTHGITEAWISIDGSNNACHEKHCAADEKDKVRENNNIGYMYAVNAADGTPLTYCTYNGVIPDNKALQQITDFLKQHNIKTAGFILNKEFCCTSLIETIKSLHYDYIVMLKANTNGYTDMVSKYGEVIRCNVKYALDKPGVFGISKQEAVPNSAVKDNKYYANLYYDAGKNIELAITQSSRICSLAKDLKQSIEQELNPVIPDELARFLTIKADSDGKKSLEYQYKEWQRSNNSKGFYAIASSQDFGAEETVRLYNLRNNSEVLFDFIKRKLGNDVIGSHNPEDLENKFVLCFITSIIRNKIAKAGKNIKNAALNQMIIEVNRLAMLLQPNGEYTAIHDENSQQKTLLNYFGVTLNVLDGIIAELNKIAKGKAVSQERTLPKDTPRICKECIIKKGRPPKVRTPEELKAKEKTKFKGRPKGSRNLKTLRREAMEALLPPKPKALRGRPKGSKNQKTLAREALEALLPPKPKALRGRPKGSKNKPKTQI